MAPTGFGPGGLFGGGERYPLELARALSAEVECRLVTFGPRPSVRDEDGLRVEVLRPLGHLHGHPAQPLAPALARRLGGADIVHTHQLRSAPSRLAAVVARASRRPLVNTDHGLGGGGWGGLLPALFHRFLTVSSYSARSLGARPDRVRVVYGGVDHRRFTPPAAGGGRSGVLFVGRLTPHKGVDVLLRALPAGASLAVVGTTGHDRQAPERDYPILLRRLAEGRAVRFAEGVGDGELPGLYRAASVFVLPSVERTCYGRRIAISELLGLTLLEAMACGTPVVASRVGGLPEVVRDGETGFLVEPGDADGLRDRLALLLGDPVLARRLGANARDLVEERFTWEACAHRCLDAYQELVAQS